METPRRKLTPSPIDKAARTKPLSAVRDARAPAYVRVVRLVGFGLLASPLALAAACGATPVRYAGAAPPVEPPPSASTPPASDPPPLGGAPMVVTPAASTSAAPAGSSNAQP